ncbi:MAG: hypothetical protein ACKVOL_01720 [Novosphingobium sp.]
MIPPTTPDDDMIYAWLDGALDKDGAQQMTDVAANDETFALRVERLRHLDDLVRAAVPTEPEITAALLERLGLADAPTQCTVIDFAAAKQARGSRPVSGLEASTGPSRFGRAAFLKVAAQVAIIAGLGLSVAVFTVPGQKAAEPAADYRVLGFVPDAAARKANALVKFVPGLAPAEAARIAAAAGVQLVGAPNAAGAWKAVAAPGRREAVLEALRADRRVSLAEPIDQAVP